MNTAKKTRAKLRKTDYLIYRNGILHAIEHEGKAAEAIALLQLCYPDDVWTAGRRKKRRPTQSVGPTPSAVGR